MGGMTELPASLVELARRYGVATEYEDWTGRHTTSPDSTLIAVLDALGVPAATEDERTAALAAHDRDYWARSLPPTIVGRSGVASSFWVHVTHGDPAGLWIRLEDGSVRTGLRQLENNRAPYDLDGRLVGEATFELPGDLPLGYHQLHLQVGASDISTLVIVSPASLELPARLGAEPGMGAGHPALQRALATILGHRRFDRPGRPRGVVGLAARCGFRSRQPVARGSAYRADGAVAVPADVAPVHQSAVSARRGDSRVRLRPAAWQHPQGARRGAGPSRRRPTGSTATPRGRPSAERWKASTASNGRRAGSWRTPLTAQREGQSLDDFATWCALAEQYGNDWHQWPEDLQHPAGPAVADFAAEHANDRRLSPLAAVAARRPAHRRAGHGRPGGHGTRRHARSRGRRRSQRR